MMQKHEPQQANVINVFSADCPLCEEAIQTVKEAVQPCGCHVRERPWEEGPQQVKYSEGGAYPVPSVSIDGQVVFDGVPDREDILQLQDSLRIGDCSQRGELIHITYNGQELIAYEGESVAASLLAANQRTLRQTSRFDQPRGLFCGMGVCFDCLVQVDGRANVQACQTPVREGMSVETQQGHGVRKSER